MCVCKKKRNKKVLIINSLSYFWKEKTKLLCFVASFAASRLLFIFLLLAVSEIIYTARLQNGLRHNDASRYHHYCSARLAHLRSKLKHKHGRQRFVAKQLPFDFHDVRYLHIPILQTERCYAAYLEAKNLQSNQRNSDGLIKTSAGNLKVSLTEFVLIFRN